MIAQLQEQATMPANFIGWNFKFANCSSEGGLICQFSRLLSVIISLSTIRFLFAVQLSITFYPPFKDIKHCRHWPLKCIIMYFDFGVSGIQCLGSGLHFILNFACELMWKAVYLKTKMSVADPENYQTGAALGPSTKTAYNCTRMIQHGILNE